jgi:hypothetical protein
MVHVTIPRQFRPSLERTPILTQSHQEASQSSVNKPTLVGTGLAKGIVREERDETVEPDPLPLNNLVQRSTLFGGGDSERVHLQVRPRDLRIDEVVSRPPRRPPGAIWKPLPVTIFYHAMQEQLMLAESES